MGWKGVSAGRQAGWLADWLIVRPTDLDDDGSPLTQHAATPRKRQVMETKDTTDSERQYWTHRGVLEEKDWSDNER